MEQAAAGDHDPRWDVRLSRLLRRERYDVVHVHSPAVAAVVRVLVRSLPRRIRPALVYTEHNEWSSHNAVTRAVNALTYPLDDATIAVSEEVRASVNASGQRVELRAQGRRGVPRRDHDAHLWLRLRRFHRRHSPASVGQPTGHRAAQRRTQRWCPAGAKRAPKLA